MYINFQKDVDNFQLEHKTCKFGMSGVVLIKGTCIDNNIFYDKNRQKFKDEEKIFQKFKSSPHFVCMLHYVYSYRIYIIAP